MLPALARPKQAEHRDRMESSEDAAYELKAGDFTLKSRPMRRPIRQAVRSAALSIAALGCSRASLRLDMARAAQIDRDGAEKLTMCRRLSSDHDVYRADLRFVWRDGPEDAVLGVRAFLVGDWNVDNGNPDSHCRHEGKLRASGNSYGVSLYCFILRQSVTVLIFRASAARFRLPLKRSSARRINSRSCDRIFKGSPGGAPFFF